jgi:hypothetical protein
MTFDPAQPFSNQSPANFPNANHANMNRLQTLFGTDHQFNDTAASNDGWHTIIQWLQQGTGPIDPLDPSAAAPANTGGPAIAWEQQDIYNTPRPWFRLPNNGNLISMSGEIEVRGVTNILATPVLCVTPPANTIGTFRIYSNTFLTSQFAYYSNDAGNFSLNTTINGTATPTTINVASDGSGGITARVVNSAQVGNCTWRLFYRYL